MVELRVRIPDDFKVDKDEMSRSLENFAKLRLARDAILRRLDELLKKSELREEECIKLGRMVKKGRFEELKRKGFL